MQRRRQWIDHAEPGVSGDPIVERVCNFFLNEGQKLHLSKEALGTLLKVDPVKLEPALNLLASILVQLDKAQRAVLEQKLANSGAELLCYYEEMDMLLKKVVKAADAVKTLLQVSSLQDHWFVQIDRTASWPVLCKLLKEKMPSIKAKELQKLSDDLKQVGRRRKQPSLSLSHNIKKGAIQPCASVNPT